MRSTYFGSRQLYDWPFYDEDCPINARAWIPMMQLLLYNRDPHLMKYFLEWADSWAKHAMEDVYGKPPGILPGKRAINGTRTPPSNASPFLPLRSAELP